MSHQPITTAAELAALPVGTKVGCKSIRTWTREPYGVWRSPEDARNPETSEELFRGHGACPMAVLHMPPPDGSGSREW